MYYRIDPEKRADILYRRWNEQRPECIVDLSCIDRFHIPSFQLYDILVS